DAGGEDIPGASESDRTGFPGEDLGRQAKPRVRRGRTLFRHPEIPVAEGQDLFARQRQLGRFVENAQLVEAQQERQGGQCVNCTSARYLLKSMEMVAGALAVIVAVTFRSPNCGFLNTISRMPSRLGTCASGVSPAFSPSIHTSAHGAALMFARPRGSIDSRVT